MPSPGSPCPAPGESHLQGNPSAGEGTRRLLFGILAPQTVAARSPHGPSGQADSCPGHSVPGASDPSWQRERFQVVSQRRPAGNARFLSARPRATYCPCGRRRRPIPRALVFLKLLQMFHVTFHSCSRQQSPGQQAKVPRTAVGRPRALPLPGAQPVSLVSGGPAHSRPPGATLTAGWAPCGPRRAAPARGSAWAWSREGGSATRPWLNCQNHSAIELPSGQPPLARKHHPVCHLVGSTRSRYPGHQVSPSLGPQLSPEALPGTGLALWFCQFPPPSLR